MAQKHTGPHEVTHPGLSRKVSTTWRGKDRGYYSKAKFKIEEIAFVVNPFKPLVRGTRGYRFGRRVTNPTLKALIRIPATYLCNIIHGLDVKLTRL